MQITLAKTIEIKQAWIGKDDAIVYFGYKGKEQSFQKLLREFKEHELFKDGYRLVTYKVPIINIQMFDKFLEWKSKKIFKN